ncbi:MAG: helix-turn-helix transcriptional regulator [Mycobacterium kyogaense]|uniref:helix-turn-helix transcriptional regulator n=1 Tax=Mycobacterium kyogaense TaxID=2212479 RepID=UPI002FFBD8D9
MKRGVALVDQLVRCRVRAGLTQAQVADVIGVCRSTVVKFENQQADPRLHTLLRYAHAVGADLVMVAEARDA